METAVRPPGVLAYRDREPVGWCAVAPRVEYERLGRSRKLKPVDSEPVWSVVCFYVARAARRSGVTTALLAGAEAFARSHGANWLEAYPVDPEPGPGLIRVPSPDVRWSTSGRGSMRLSGRAAENDAEAVGVSGELT